MSEAELQTDSEIELETGETGAESATADVDETGKVEVPEGYIKAEDAQKDINRQHKKYRDEERARKALEAEAERLRKERDELKAKTVDVTVPPIPDPYDDDYQEKIRARDEALTRKAQHDAQVKDLDAQEQRNKEKAANDLAAKQREKVAAFDANMVTLGANPVEVKKAADTVVGYGITENLENYILEDPEGALITQYLATNPIEIDALNGMSVYEMSRYLEGTVRQKAQLLRPQTSQAPNPPETLKGGGVKEQEHPLLQGVTFE